MGKRKTVDILPEANRRRLLDKLRAFRPRILHFIGHACPEPCPEHPDGSTSSPRWLVEGQRGSRRSGFPGAPDDPGDLTAPSLVLEGRHTATQRRHDYLTADELPTHFIEPSKS